MIMKGRAISPGKAEGEAITYPEAFSFLGGVDGSTGDFRVRDGNIAGKVFLFPNGKGSTVGSYVVYDLKVHGKAPLALVNRSAETIVTTGAVISSVPMVDGIDVSVVRDGDIVAVDGDKGCVEIKGVELRHTTSSVLVHDGKVLFLKRPADAHSFPGKVSLVSGCVEEGETPEQTARREIREETGIEVGSPDAIGKEFLVREKNVVWDVHPFLFNVDTEKVVLDRENDAFRWAVPGEIPEADMVDGVPGILAELLKKD
jgi:predicted aconitase with swiveling domain